MAVSWKGEEKSVTKSLAQSRRARASRQHEYEELVTSGRAIDPKAAMARCFAAGNHGNEALRGGFD